MNFYGVKNITLKAIFDGHKNSSLQVYEGIQMSTAFEKVYILAHYRRSLVPLPRENKHSYNTSRISVLLSTFNIASESAMNSHLYPFNIRPWIRVGIGPEH